MRLHKTLPATVALAALVLGSQQVLATPDLKISGFGTAGYVTTNTNGGEFRSNIRQHKGATKSDGDWGVDSRLGLQANVTFDDVFSAVGQLYISRRDGDSSPEAEWLFVQADLADWVSLRAGRMVLPAFMLSDFRHVGYAQHWLRTPVEVYGAFNTTSYDGVQAILRHQAGDYNLTAQISAGVSDDERIYGRVGGTLAENKEENSGIYSANLSAERGDWTVRVSHTFKHDTEISAAKNTSLYGGLVTIPGGTVFGRGDDHFTNVGVLYDNGSLLAMSEYVWRHWKVRNHVGGKNDSEAFYITAGYRFGSVMPYATYSQIDPTGNGYSNGTEVRKTKAIGVRWDIVRNLAFKAQYEEITGGAGDQLMPFSDAFLNDLPKVRAYSASLDFIF